MKLLTTPLKITHELTSAMKNYEHFYWAIAWASTSPECYSLLGNNKNKIARLIIGTHFYQTHPDFIKRFIDNNNVRYMKQTNGIFHPKIYLFENTEHDWALFIGSANFTKGALTKNIEAVIVVTSNDNNAETIHKNAKSFVLSNWQDGQSFNIEQLADYRQMWNRQRYKIESLSGAYGSVKAPKKPAYEAKAIKMAWEAYLNKVYADKHHGVNSRLQVLNKARQLFQHYTDFGEMTQTETKAIAGILSKNNENIILGEKDDTDWLWFGSMRGCGIFQKQIIAKNKHITDAINSIPLAGPITIKEYNVFVNTYKKAFPKNQNMIATSTRLLSMKRPDIFICLDNKNKKKLCEDYGIKASDMSYSRYWEEIVERIFDSAWWKVAMPNNGPERQIWQNRSAFLDAIYYEE